MSEDAREDFARPPLGSVLRLGHLADDFLGDPGDGSFDSLAPNTSAKRAPISPVVRPVAHSDNTFSFSELPDETMPISVGGLARSRLVVNEHVTPECSARRCAAGNGHADRRHL